MSKTTRPSISTQVGNASENVGLFPNEIGHLVTWVMEKAEVLNAFIASIFLATLAVRNPRDHPRGMMGREDVPLAEEGQFKKYLSKLGIHKSMDPDGMHHKCCGSCHMSLRGQPP